MQNISPAQRLDWVDFAKGLVMVTVVSGHVIYGNGACSQAVLIAVYEFHMPFFFVMAGFLLNLTKWGGGGKV